MSQSAREAAIRARLAAATPGPWDEEWVRGAVRHIARNVDTEAFYDGETDFGWDRYNDAPLIANAPADLDYLLTALSEAREGAAYAQTTSSQWQETANKYRSALVEVDTYLANDPEVWRIVNVCKAGDVLCDVLGSETIAVINAGVQANLCANCAEARAALTPTEAVTPLEWRDAPGHAQFESEEAWQDTGQRWAIWHNRSTIDDSGYELSTLSGQSYATIATFSTLEAAQALAARLDAVLREEGA